MNALTSLAPRGWSVLPQSHLVPVDVWLRSGPVLLHLSGRGTTVRLRRYAESDLAVALLRAECDCQSHREAGAAARVVLRPGAAPSASVAYDGAARHGWTGVEAARLRADELRPVLAELLADLLASAGPAPAPAATPAPAPAPVVEPVETTLAV
ncbi:hypothetical protein [Nocardioides marmoribigeumensis]|uniref:Uncharacterized protein n=1 Tax=Nocardioides marmoribigeumensis TaxID=433649 RepID=A0ABU2BRA4_9ACTN|nr:hypothetical protein [Nocardioides marmoribigeumensis]MDR7361162.1 hypothetical protein [Nocardioides marmoribigeumensis]